MGEVSVCVIQLEVSGDLCVFSRDLIKVLKWYVDRIVEAEHQEHIQQVLKVRPVHKINTCRNANKQISFVLVPRLLI